MIYIIVGPTASGKSKYALELSKYFNDAPIINADAFQIYKEMDIGTAKVMPGTYEYQLHHLLDIKSPDEEFSVMEYQKLFREKVDELSKTHENIIVCGGTGLYIKASIYDYVFEELEEDDTSDLEKLSNDELYEMLVKLDFESTKIIHKNNRKRVIRAISIARNSKTTKSESVASQEHKLIYPEDSVKIFMIDAPREKIYARVNERVDEMVRDGLIEEVKALLEKYNLSITASQAIGYKEVIQFLNGEISLEESIELIKKRTRNYVKRQLTFFRHQFNCIPVKNFEEILKEVH